MNDNRLELVISSSTIDGFIQLLQELSALANANAEATEARAKAAEALAPQEAPKAEPAPAKPKTTPAEIAPSVPEQYDAPAASIDAVRKALVSLIEAGKQAQVQELFQRFGGEKLSDIAEDKLGELLEAAKELAS